jgi:glycolate oxidase FAD binding subunit
VEPEYVPIIQETGSWYAAPATALQVAQALAWARTRAMPVGIHQSLDFPQYLYLDLSKLKQVVSCIPEDRVVTVEAGIKLLELDRYLAELGQQVGLESHNPEATLGMVLAGDHWGPRRGHFGGARDLVLGAQAACIDGTLVQSGSKVLRNTAGYDLAKLWTGSRGTLAVITQVSLRLSPLWANPRTLLLSFRILDRAIQAAERLIKAHVTVQGLELLSDALARSLIVEKDAAPWYVVVRMENQASLMEGEIGYIRELCAPLADRIEDISAQQTGLWQALTCPSTTEQVRVEAILPVGSVQDYCEAVGPGAMHSHLACGMVSRYLDRGPDLLKTIRSLRRIAARLGGSLRVYDPSGTTKAEGIKRWQVKMNTLQELLSQRLKDQFDPSRLLNPGEEL